jgi:predicted nucleotidyltransferase
MVHINQRSGIMLTGKQLNIFKAFAKYPFKEYTRQNIKTIAQEKSNNALSLAFSQFKKEDLLIEKKVGKSSLYTLNLKNDLVFYYIALINEDRLNKIVKTSISYVKEETKKITPFFSIIIFGSFAIKQEKKDSDLDIAILVEDKNIIKNLKINLKDAELKSLINLDINIVTKEDMIEMLINDEENLGKQIAKKHMVVYNHQLFYDILKEGIKNGFRI